MTDINDKALNRARSVLLDHGFIVPFTVAEKAVAAYLEALPAPPQMVVVSTTDVDQNGDHIERLIARSEWESI